MAVDLGETWDGQELQAGIASTFLSFEDVIARIDAAQAPGRRGAYKKRLRA